MHTRVNHGFSHAASHEDALVHEVDECEAPGLPCFPIVGNVDAGNGTERTEQILMQGKQYGFRV